MPRRPRLRPPPIAAVLRSKVTLAFAAERQDVGRTAKVFMWAFGRGAVAGGEESKLPGDSYDPSGS